MSKETDAARAAAVEIALKVLIAELSNHALLSGNPFGQRYLERLEQIASAAGTYNPLATELADFSRGVQAMIMR